MAIGYLIEKATSEKATSEKATSEKATSDTHGWDVGKGLDEQGDLLILLDYYRLRLDDMDVLMKYMTDEQRKRLETDLKVTERLLLAQKKREEEHIKKRENLKAYQVDICRCKRLQHKLASLQNNQDQQRPVSPMEQTGTDGYPLKYLGLFLGYEFAAQVVDFSNHRTKVIVGGMTGINEKRLYWVWSSNLLGEVMNFIPSTFFNADSAKTAMAAPNPYTGYMSWVLYYFRFGLNFGLMLKHTIPGKWLSEEEKKRSLQERFSEQCQQRKFTLLNDLLWATANMACFLWLKGGGVAEAWGGVLTLVLLAFDISMAALDLHERKLQYDAQMKEYALEIKGLESQLGSPDQQDSNLIKELNYRLAVLKQLRDQCEREWVFKKIGLINNIAYASGLMLAFFIWAQPLFEYLRKFYTHSFVPVAAPVPLIGAALCFAFTVISNAVKGGIEVHRAKMGVKEASSLLEQKVNAFQQLMSQSPRMSLSEKKFLYLEIQQLKAETEYQKKMVVFQTMHLVRSVVFEALLPALVFASFVFLPLGGAIGLLAGVIALTVLVNALTNYYKPKKKELQDVDDENFNKFLVAHSQSSSVQGYSLPSGPSDSNEAYLLKPPSSR